MLLALLIAAQGMTAGLGNQFVTGSCVNLILTVAVLMTGFWSGATIAVVSPFLAFAFNIGPKFVQLLPLIAAGNLVLVLVWYFSARGVRTAIWKQIVGWLCAAVAKFVALYLLVVKIAAPALVGGGIIPQKAGVAIAAQFSWPQLVTALVGGGVALLIVPVLKKALRRN